jgi:flagellar biosynthesis/type III secretory pathway ATPase
MVEVSGPLHAMSVGARVVVETQAKPSQAKPIPGEVVGFTGANVLLMPFAPLEDFLSQGQEEATSLADGYRRLDEILNGSETER